MVADWLQCLKPGAWWRGKRGTMGRNEGCMHARPVLGVLQALFVAGGLHMEDRASVVCFPKVLLKGRDNSQCNLTLVSLDRE